MAETLGIVAGSIGIAAAFTACVDCFEYVQVARHFERDFKTQFLSLGLARLRLTRWGQAVNINHDPSLGRPDISLSEIQAAKDTLLHVLDLFANTKKIAERYRPNAQAAENLLRLGPGNPDPLVMELSNKLRNLAIKRREKGPGILKTARWTLYDRSELEHLIQGITSLTGNLETLFPASHYQRAVKEEAALLGDKHALSLIQDAARDVDPLLQAAAKEALGHKYSNMKIQGNVLAGDTFSSNWKGDTSGRSHLYNGFEVGTSGKVQMGNSYGQPFW